MTMRRHDPMDDDMIELTQDLPPLVPDGQYDAVVISVKKLSAFQGRRALRFRFQIVTEGACFRQVIPAYAKLGADGQKVSPHSKLASWMRVVSDFTDSRPNRVSLRSFKDFQFRIRAETVTHNAQGQLLPLRDRYSKVADLIAVVGKLVQSPPVHERGSDVTE